MGKYEIWVKPSSCLFQIEADDFDEALKKFKEEMDDTMFTITTYNGSEEVLGWDIESITRSTS